ncbi:MAG: S-methyl-5'-thioadenosine phosphorylase [Planctomycetota bacterium]|jgi:5'-methylthioadenosine phosphorylase
MADVERAEIGILGGTGLYGWSGLEDARDVQIETPFGTPSAPLRVGRTEGRRVAFLARHGPHHAIFPHEIPYRANVWALKHLGVSKVLASSAVGSLREDLPPRSLVAPDQFIDRTRQRGNTFFGKGLVAHVSLAEPFSKALREALVAGGEEAGHAVRDGGTYLCMEGPQFSTRAESGWYRTMGCDVIGMTSLTEARLFREAEIAYASLCLVTDYDAWREEEEAVSAAEILNVLKHNAAAAANVLRAALRRVPEGELPENRCLAQAIVTPLDRIPAAVRQRLHPILAPYLE